MTKHTPGPWQHRQPNAITKEHTIRAFDGGVVLAKMKNDHGANEIEANARLMSAAPELLDLLKEYAASNEPVSLYQDADYQRRVREIIAKVDGEVSTEQAA